ncbi:radical SAM protein [Pseudenhygromyxa sp. WMMC2535]|uniref:4Fe-4S single cluster domain-containing protein n=1 Tax=Pseudenhygromyxa sp. WMMC2535 TaxID=2712867 RepID=UPI001553E372|nr:4Fe-4S single cluster domain-containing protein [Pseudenhygromyxa sp. WMMC2535]NVB39829.1 radical SAM protein [Pseudenhygromyxa sp. WMMC2535]
MDASLELGHPLATLRPSSHNGPGLRVALWLKGCSLRCTRDCLNPHLLDPRGGHRHTVEQVSDRVRSIAAVYPRLKGLTVLGGEPTDQARPLAELLRRVRELGLTTMVYSGYTLTALRRDVDGRGQILAHVDLLVDGPYMDSLYDETLAWRGSSNQSVHRLSAAYSRADLERAYADQKKGCTISVTSSGLVSITGFQSRPAVESVERLLSTALGSPSDG